MIKKYTKTILTFLLLIVITPFSSCIRSFNKYLTKIEVISDGSNRQIRLSAEEPTGSYFVLGTTWLSAPEGETISVVIDWTESPWDEMNPRSDDFYFWEVTEVETGYGYSGPDIYEGTKISDAFKLKPGIIYEWDANTGEITNTGERTERKKSGNGIFSGGACDITKTWKLKTLNGNTLPWKEYDDGSNTLTWMPSTSWTIKSDGTWTSKIVSNQNVNGDKKEVLNEQSGTYTCDNGSISFINSAANGGSWQATHSDGELTWSLGNYSYVWE